MNYKSILYAKENSIATITLNRPEKLNAYNKTMVEELLAAVEDVKFDDDVHVLVITGAGRGFCAAADIGPSYQPHKEGHPLGMVEELREWFHRLLFTLRNLDKPTIASINGPAAAGGLSLALACDLRIASEQAKLGTGVLRIGTIPDEGETYFLPRVVGIEKAIELILLGEILDAKEALQIGLVGRVVPHEQLEATTKELAARIAEGPPIAQRLVKRAVYRQLEMNLWASLDDTALSAQISTHTQDSKEGLRAFQEKRQPIFRGM